MWEDTSLLNWDSNDYRLFAGDLGGWVVPGGAHVMMNWTCGPLVLMMTWMNDRPDTPPCRERCDGRGAHQNLLQVPQLPDGEGENQLLNCDEMVPQVVRDKRSNKTKGYGFISFKNPDDFTKAIKDMNGASDRQLVVCSAVCSVQFTLL